MVPLIRGCRTLGPCFFRHPFLGREIVGTKSIQPSFPLISDCTVYLSLSPFWSQVCWKFCWTTLKSGPYLYTLQFCHSIVAWSVKEHYIGQILQNRRIFFEVDSKTHFHIHPMLGSGVSDEKQKKKNLRWRGAPPVPLPPYCGKSC